MLAGMVPVNALFVNILIAQPHDANAEGRQNENCRPSTG
jgi:hypothetical protein